MEAFSGKEYIEVEMGDELEVSIQVLLTEAIAEGNSRPLLKVCLEDENGLIRLNDQAFWFAKRVDGSKVGEWQKLTYVYKVPNDPQLQNKKLKLAVYGWNPSATEAYFDDLAVSQKRTATEDLTVATTDVISWTDYYAFGAPKVARCFEKSDGYRYGFNGMEKDDKGKGRGNSYTTYFRQYDSRLGRWQSIDPKGTSFQSPYLSMGGNPILYMDPLGDTTHIFSSENGKYLGTEFGDEQSNKKLKNEVHFMTERMYKDVTNLLDNSGITDKGKREMMYRIGSDFFIDKKSADDFEKIAQESTAANNGYGQEKGFIAYVSPTKRLRFFEVEDSESTSNSIALKPVVESNTAGASLETWIVGAGHTHPEDWMQASAYSNEWEKLLHYGEPSDPGFNGLGYLTIKDYQPILRDVHGNYRQSLMFISTTAGLTIYSSSTTVGTIEKDRTYAETVKKIENFVRPSRKNAYILYSFFEN
ncbi:MAG: hypothetical protein GY827_00220 [Cytophagales bacterium]|nr:hypothetical protein [Cytophagales bacterium]